MVELLVLTVVGGIIACAAWDGMKAVVRKLRRAVGVLCTPFFYSVARVVFRSRTFSDRSIAHLF